MGGFVLIAQHRKPALWVIVRITAGSMARLRSYPSLGAKSINALRTALTELAGEQEFVAYFSNAATS